MAAIDRSQRRTRAPRAGISGAAGRDGALSIRESSSAIRASPMSRSRLFGSF